MGSLHRQCLIAGALYLLGTVVVAATYFLYFRRTWMTPEVLVGVPSRLVDAATPSEEIRDIALKGHRLILDSFAVLDVMIVFLLVVSISAAAILIYVGAKIRSAKHENTAL